MSEMPRASERRFAIIILCFSSILARRAAAPISSAHRSQRPASSDSAQLPPFEVRLDRLVGFGVGVLGCEFEPVCVSA